MNYLVMIDFSRLIHHFQKTYFIEVLMLIFELSALITGILFARKYKTGVLFIFYITFDFIILLADWYFVTHSDIKHETRSFFLHTTNTLIALFELIAYYYYLYMLNDSKKIKKLIKLLAPIYIGLVILYLITKLDFISNNFNYTSNIMGAIEFLFLIPFCFVFFQQVLNKDSSLSLFARPSFWIVTGIFFYSFISIPYYLVVTYFYDIGYEFKNTLDTALYFIPLTLNFLFLTKAFLCKKPLTI
jgi:hypothetical protein